MMGLAPTRRSNLLNRVGAFLRPPLETHDETVATL